MLHQEVHSLLQNAFLHLGTVEMSLGKLERDLDGRQRLRRKRLALLSEVTDVAQALL